MRARRDSPRKTPAASSPSVKRDNGDLINGTLVGLRAAGNQAVAGLLDRHVLQAKRGRPSTSIHYETTWVSVDQTDPGFLLASQPITAGDFYYLVWGNPTNVDENPPPPMAGLFRPDEASVSKNQRGENAYMRFELLRFDRSIHNGMNSELSRELIRLRHLRGGAKPLTDPQGKPYVRRSLEERLQRQAPWVPPEVVATIRRLQAQGSFEHDLPWVGWFPYHEPGYGNRLWVWVGREFAGRELTVEAFAERSETLADYEKRGHRNERWARLAFAAGRQFNADMRYFVQVERLSPSEAQRRWAELNAKVLAMMLEAVANFYASMAGTLGERPPEIAGPELQHPLGERLGEGDARLHTRHGSIDIRVPRRPRGPTSLAGEGRFLTSTEAAAEFGIPKSNLEKIQEVAERHQVELDIRPTTVEAPELLAQGAHPKPAGIKAKTITELDTYLGARHEDLGKVGYFKPALPERRPAGISRREWKSVVKRYNSRLEEFNELAKDMEAMEGSGAIRVENGVVLHGRDLKPHTGDHDIFWIGPGEVDEITKAQVLRELEGAGVTHPAHLDWMGPLLPKDQRIKEQIIAQHQKGGVPLLRVGPGRALYAH